MRLITALIFSFQVTALANLVVVSDIDDTIKVSHVLDPDSVASNSLRVGNVFRGMTQLYNLIAQKNKSTKFYYLTNAPKAGFSKIHGLFLWVHQFPKGELLLRQDIRDQNHKIRSLRKIFQRHPEAQFVLIGDNGEKDPLVYKQIKLENPQAQVLTFIREAYSSKHSEPDDRGMRLFPGQNGFVTPLEISLGLQLNGILNVQAVSQLEYFYVPPTLQSAREEDADGDTGTLSFPSWIDCRDFKIPEYLKMRQTKLTQLLIQRILQRCSVPPFDD